MVEGEIPSPAASDDEGGGGAAPSSAKALPRRTTRQSMIGVGGTEVGVLELPEGWVEVDSRSRPGESAFINIFTQEKIGPS